MEVSGTYLRGVRSLIDMDHLRIPLQRESPLHPPAVLSVLRAEQPICRVTLSSGQQAWLATRYADVRAILENNRFSADATRPSFPAGPGRAQGKARRTSFSRMDDPRHAELRRMVSHEFSPRRMQELKPKIEELVDELLTKMLDEGSSADFVRSFATPLPSRVICEILGVPYSEHEHFEFLSTRVMRCLGSGEDVRAAEADLFGYLEDLVERKEKAPTNDLIGRLVLTYRQKEELSHDELVNMARLLLVAGYETSANMIALSILSLLLEPALMVSVQRDPNLISGLVDELLRYHTILHNGVPRVATEDIQIGDAQISAGDPIILSLLSANRDGSRFREPDKIDIDRGAGSHLAFGHGIHRCLGQQLAHIELQAAISGVIRRIPDVRLAVPVEDLDFRVDMSVYGLNALPLEWA